MRGFITTKPQHANELDTVKEQKGMSGKSASEFEPSCGDAHLKSSPKWAEGRGKITNKFSTSPGDKGLGKETL